MTAFLADVNGLARCRIVVMRGHYAVVQPRDTLMDGARVKLTLAGEDGTEMTCLCEVQEMSRRLAFMRILAWETNEDAPLRLVAQERVVH